MTEEEKKSIVDAVIAQLKKNGTDISDAEIVTDASGISSILCYSSSGDIVKITPDALSSSENDISEVVAQLSTQIAEEIQRAQLMEQQLQEWMDADKQESKDADAAIRANAMQYDTLGVNTYANKAEIYGRSISGTPRTFDFPAATKEKAGVMSAADKAKLDNLSQGGEGGDTDVVGLPNDKEVAYNITDDKTKLAGNGAGISQSYWYIADKPIQDSGCRLKTITFQHTANANKNYIIGIFRKKGDVFYLQGYSSMTYYGDGTNGWHTEVVDVYNSLPYLLMKGDYIGVMTATYFIGGYKENVPVGWTLPFSAMHDPNNIVKEYAPTTTNVGLWIDFTTTGVDKGTLYSYELSKERFLTINTPTPREKRYNCTNDTKIFLLGDSIASDTAVGGSTADHNYDGWQKSLAEILGIPESNIIRGGMPGLGAGWFSGDATWSSGGIKSVVGANPDIIISIVGANDSGEQWTVGTFSGVIEGEPICRDIPFSEATQGQYGSVGAEYFIQNVSWIVQRYLNTYYDLRTLANITDSDSYEDVDAKMSAVKQPRLIICTTLPQNRGGSNAHFSKPENWKRKRDAIVEVCNKYNIECVDLLEAMPWNPEKEPSFTSAVWQNKGIYTMDGLHPNKAGFKVISEIICKQAGLVNGQTAVERGGQLALRSLFIAAGAEYNDTDEVIQKTAPWGTEEKWRLEDDGTYTYWEEPAVVEHLPKHYYLNGLGDITEEQMMDIYNITYPALASTSWDSLFRKNVVKDIIPRTNLFYSNSYSFVILKSISGAFYGSTIEIIRVIGANVENNESYVFLPTNTGHAFVNCKATHVIGRINLKNDSQNIIYAGSNMPNIRYIYIYDLKHNLPLFTNSVHIEKRCILRAIQKATPTTAITITLHPDAYVRIANQPDILEALEAKPLVTLVSA